MFLLYGSQMSYQVLARKWRPTNFTEMVGQTPILRALIYALDHGQLHHAYLFTGTRGVGKTTIARILAKCFNCEQGISANPCGVCASCVAIAEGRSLDLIEVDAASRTKVEQTRELLDNIHYAPAHSRFKIYLIDEVHMLSGHSFNALLKTLEEPPAHVKFLLATTDPDRLPLTVLSRCLRFHLKNISEEGMVEYLTSILQQEKIQAEEPALSLLARAAQGSLRDALSLLDQAIAYGEGCVTAIAVRELLGALDTDSALCILSAVHAQDTAKLMAEIAVLASQGIDFAQAFSEVLQLLQQMAIYKAISKPAEVFTTGAQTDARFKTLCDAWSAEDIQIFYQIVLQGRRDLPWSVSPRAAFEMTLLRVLAFYPDVGAEVAAVPAARAQTMAKAPIAPAPQVVPKTASAISPKREAAPVAAAVAPRANVENQTWEDIVPRLKLTGMADTVAKHCILKTREAGQWTLLLAPQHTALLNPSLVARIEAALVTYMGQPMRVQILLEAHHTETLAATTAKAQEKHKEALGQSVRPGSHCTKFSPAVWGSSGQYY